MEMSITLIIVIVTALVSIGGMTNQKIIDDLIFYPPSIKRGQVYRFITHGFIHADAFHLIFNMLALYSFGEALEKYYLSSPFTFGSSGKLVYILLYFTGLIVASLPDYIRHRDHYHYRSLGASGAVSAVIFSTILFNPTSGIGFAFIPGITIPGYIFGILYLVISTVLARRGQDNIGHSAHITGAIYGLVFTYIATTVFTDYPLIDSFIQRITGQ
jgi:membrane associated rhomboid family serine protease